MKIALSAAETSGDLIASSLVVALKNNDHHCEIDGLAGDKMIEAGCNSLWHTDEVNVMGLSEVLKKLPSVLKLRTKVTNNLNTTFLISPMYLLVLIHQTSTLGLSIH